MKLLIAKVFGTGFGTGYSPVASGTAGSALAVLMYWFIPTFSDTPVLLAMIAIFFVIGVWASTELESVYGHDPSEATIDEFVGQWISLLFLPRTALVAALSFFFFRLFDITKPEPASSLEKLPKGWGVMMDDVMAGIYANVAVQVILFAITKWQAT
jgi:phosphatidylglycerophosphatase A